MPRSSCEPLVAVTVPLISAPSAMLVDDRMLPFMTSVSVSV